jgi:uncharacterized MAPEG superfamily protein
MEVQMTEAMPMQMCPMAGTCKGMMQRPFSGLAFIIAGISFIALGLLNIYEPRSLFWLLASCFVLVGVIMLATAAFMRKLATRFQSVKS